MSSPSVTYTFVGGTTAVAAQVNTNYTDLINGITDGTKDLTILNLTAKTSVKIKDSGAGTNLVTLQALSGILANYTYFVPSTIAKSADYTILDTDGITTILGTSGASNITMTLPAAANNPHRTLIIKKVDSGAGYVVISRAGSNTIDGATTKCLTAQFEAIVLQSDGTIWHIIEEKLGAILSSVVSSTTTLSNSTIANITNLALPPGEWEVYGSGDFSGFGAGTQAVVGVSSANNTLGTVPYDNSTTFLSSSLTSRCAISFGAFPITVTGTTSTTYFMNVQCTFSSGTIIANGSFYARKRRLG